MTDHNSEAGYQMHRKLRASPWPWPPDDECGCRVSHNESVRRYALYPVGVPGPRHGTISGYCTHARRRCGQWSWPPDDACQDARRIYWIDYKQRRKAADNA